jgi:hypothetical protein
VSEEDAEAEKEEGGLEEDASALAWSPTDPMSGAGGEKALLAITVGELVADSRFRFWTLSGMQTYLSTSGRFRQRLIPCRATSSRPCHARWPPC